MFPVAWSMCYVHCDNACVVQVVNSGSCKNASMMELLWTLFFICVEHHFELHWAYINTHENILVDALIHLDDKCF